MSEEEFAARSVIIASLPVTNSDFGLKTMTYRDTLEFAGQPVRLRYSIRFANASGQRAAFSNFFLIEPAARVANPPTSLSATVAQDAITLAWTAPTQNVDGSTPANVLGYNVYRSPSATRGRQAAQPNSCLCKRVSPTAHSNLQRNISILFELFRSVRAESRLRVSNHRSWQ